MIITKASGFPELFDRALAGRAGELSDVKVRGGLVYAPKIEILEADPEHKAFTWYSWHIGGYERKKQAEGHDLNDVAAYYLTFADEASDQMSDLGF